MIDRAAIYFPCPHCDFQNDVTAKEVRLRDVLICRGCKANVQLEDQMNTFRMAERRVKEAIHQLAESMKTIGGTLTIRL